ncbi:MAG: DUF2330 domain-containing protein [Candidatus Moranbacteria bacterium]|nr:DUF2330 domain-containing protein [Candidatus Moranbacteria bacterium]
MLKKIRFKISLILLTVLFIPPLESLADGALIPPKNQTIWEDQQKAVIFYEKGVETLVLSISFQGNAQDFAWVIPTPSRPKVEKSSHELFTKLDQITQTKEMKASGSGNLFPARKVQDTSKSVTVIESKKIDYYDVTVLEASDQDALYNWLNDNGYKFPLKGREVVNQYIQKGWFFTAVKISNNNQKSLAQKELEAASATPLKLTFKSSALVYPLKISSISGMQDVSRAGEIYYVDGAKGKAAQIDRTKILGADISNDFNLENGRISFYLKKRDADQLGTILNIKKIPDSANNFSKESLEIYNINQNEFWFELKSQKQFENQKSLKIFVRLEDDFKPNQWQKYEFSWDLNENKNNREFYFSIDGQEKKTTINKSNGGLLQNVGALEQSKITLGGKVQTGNAFKEPRIENRGRTKALLIDELLIQSDQKYLMETGFSQNLIYQKQQVNNQMLEVIHNDNAYQNIDEQSPEEIGVLLYIFADSGYSQDGFENQYGGWFLKEEIQKLASVDGNPWIKPLSGRYYLTKLHKNLEPEEMTHDLYPVIDQKTRQNTDQNFQQTNYQQVIIFLLIFIGLMMTVIMTLVFLLLKKFKK